MVIALPLLLAGLVVLVVGGELLVRGASSLAAAARVSPLLIGLTVVAFGTSAPELAVSLRAVASGQPDVAVGNVVGSNIANVLLILGLSAMIVPMAVSSQLIRFELPLMVAVSFATLGLALDQEIGRLDGAVLFGTLLVYLAWSLRQSRRESREVEDEFAREYGRPRRAGSLRLAGHALLVLAGIALLVLGSRWLIRGAVDIARWLEVSELIIGLTIVAVGTSLPELVTSAVAAIRGERDIAVGNVVGSNLFNLLAVLGLTGLIAPGGVFVSPVALRFDIPVMIAVAVACLPIFFTGQRIARWEGALFLGYYAAYLAYLVLVAVESSFTRTFAVIMLGFVLPLTAVILLVGVVGSLRQAVPPRE